MMNHKKISYNLKKLLTSKKSWSNLWAKLVEELGFLTIFWRFVC